MVVNWKDPASTDRLIAAIIAAHPSLKLEYHKVATFFGQGSTYDAIEGRLQRYRSMANDMRSQFEDGDLASVPRARVSAPSTPRTPRVGGRITKNSSSGKGRSNARSNITTPTRRGIPTRSITAGMNALDVICLDSDEETDSKADGNVNTTDGTADTPRGQRGAAVRVDSDMEIIEMPAPSQPVGPFFPMLEERAILTRIIPPRLPALARVKEEGRDDQRFPSATPPNGLSIAGLTPDPLDMDDDSLHSSEPYVPTNHAPFSFYHGLSFEPFDELDGTA